MHLSSRASLDAARAATLVQLLRSGQSGVAFKHLSTWPEAPEAYDSRDTRGQEAFEVIQSIVALVRESHLDRSVSTQGYRWEDLDLAESLLLHLSANPN